MSAINYIRLMFVSTLILILSAITLNWVVDPYGYFGHVSIEGFNAGKIAINRKMRMYKARLIQRVRPQEITLGSSRAMVFSTPLLAESIYVNAALAGSGIEEQWQYLQFANAVGRLKAVTYIADFFSFNGQLAEAPDHDAARVEILPDGSVKSVRWEDVRDVLIGLKTLGASLETIYRNRIIHQHRVTDSSSRGESLSRFRSMEETFLNKMWVRDASGDYSFTQPNGVSTLDIFRQMCRFTAERNIDLSIIISPVHVRLQLALMLDELRDRYEEWVQSLVETIASVRAEFPRSNVTLWEFGGVNRFTTESVLADRQGTLRYFSDSSHFTHEVVDMMYAVLQGQSIQEPGFGIRLEVDNVRSEMAMEREDLEEYAESKPDIVADLGILLSTARKREIRQHAGNHAGVEE